MLKLCSHDWDALEVARLARRRRGRAVGDGADDRGRLHALRAPGDRVPRRARAADAASRRTCAGSSRRRRRKPILFFPARHDHWLVQTGDGYAAHVAGAIGVSTDAQSSWWGGRGIGTVPHALIASYDGDTVAAAKALRRVGARGHERRRPRGLRERLGAHVAGGGARPSARGSGVCGSTRRSGSSTGRSGTRSGDFDPRGVNERLVRRSARRSTPKDSRA